MEDNIQHHQNNAPQTGDSQVSVAVHRKPKTARLGVAKVILLVCLAFMSGLSGAATFSLIERSGNNATSNSTINTTTITNEGEAIAKVVEKVSPSVVSIIANGTTTNSSSSDSSSSWWFGGDNTRTYQTSSAGTGVIISSDGYIITNKHVIGENTSSVAVITKDGTEYDNVKVVGRDPLNDIAFLKINKVSGLPAAEFGDSSSVAVGSRVIAIGNVLGEYQNTVTSGIISGTGRTITAQIDSTSTETLTNLLQTDAAINSGNSGGPLVTLDGKVIGINTAIIEDAQGIGFSIPTNEAKGVMTSVLKNGKVERAYIGVRYLTLTSAVAKENNLSVSDGAYLKGDSSGPAVISGSPADKAGLKDGDVITAVNGTKLSSSVQLSSMTSMMMPGDKAVLTVLRGSETLTITVILGVYE